MTEKTKKILTVFALFLSAVFTAAICYYVGKPLIRFAQNPEKFRGWVESNGLLGKVYFVAIIVFQVVIAVVPGEPFEIGAGYAFGTAEGTLLTMIGIAIGSALVFFIVRTLGVRIVEVFFSVEKIRSLRFIKNSKRLNLLTFIILLLPGTPKDLISYFIGLTNIKFSYWMFIVCVARIPSVITSTAAGDALGIKRYKLAVIFLISTVIISVIGIIYYRVISKKEEKKAEKGESSI